jgi:hypothetical protein
VGGGVFLVWQASYFLESEGRKGIHNKISKQRRKEIYTASKNVRNKTQKYLSPCFFHKRFISWAARRQTKKYRMPVPCEGKEKKGGCASLLEEETELWKVMARCGSIRLATSVGCVRKQRDTYVRNSHEELLEFTCWNAAPSFQNSVSHYRT